MRVQNSNKNPSYMLIFPLVVLMMMSAFCVCRALQFAKNGEERIGERLQRVNGSKASYIIHYLYFPHPLSVAESDLFSWVSVEASWL